MMHQGRKMRKTCHDLPLLNLSAEACGLSKNVTRNNPLWSLIATKRRQSEKLACSCLSHRGKQPWEGCQLSGNQTRSSTCSAANTEQNATSWRVASVAAKVRVGPSCQQRRQTLQGTLPRNVTVTWPWLSYGWFTFCKAGTGRMKSWHWKVDQ